MRPKGPFWKHRAPKMRLVEAQCAHRKHCYPETPLGSHPTSRVSQYQVAERTFCASDSWGLKRVAPVRFGCGFGGFKRGASRSGLVLPFLSFLGLSRFFWDFPDLLGDGPGIFPIRPFPLSRPIKSTYEEQSRKGPRHNLDLSRKKWETPGF